MRLIDAEPIERELFKQADRSLAKNPYENAKIRAFRRAFELVLNTPAIASPPNDPLTLEELREMDGEPVWTVTLSVDGSGRWELCTCEVVTACPLHKVLRCVTATGEVTDYELDTYEKTWLAYRRKPEAHANAE